MARIERCENQIQLFNNVDKICQFYDYLLKKKELNKANIALHKTQINKSRALDWYDGYGECLKQITEAFEHSFLEELQ